MILYFILLSLEPFFAIDVELHKPSLLFFALHLTASGKLWPLRCISWVLLERLTKFTHQNGETTGKVWFGEGDGFPRVCAEGRAP